MRWRWPISIAVVLVGAASALALWWREAARPARSALQVDVEIRTPLATDGHGVEVDGTRRVTIVAPGADAIWVYRAGGGLVARCPGTPACRISPGQLRLAVVVDLAARHRVLAIRGLRTMTPSGDFEADVLEARTRGARVELRVIPALRSP